MKPPFRLALLTGLCALLPTALLAGHFWFAGGDFPPGPALLGRLKEENRRAEELDARRAAVQVRSEFKAEVVEDLVAGRLTLSQAVGWFRSIDASCGSPAPEALGYDEEEYPLHSLLVQAQALLRTRPDIAGVARARLEAELRDYREQEKAYVTGGARAWLN